MALQMIALNMTLQQIISDWPIVGHVGLYTFHGQVTLYRIGVLSSARHARERKWRQHEERFKIYIF